MYSCLIFSQQEELVAKYKRRLQETKFVEELEDAEDDELWVDLNDNDLSDVSNDSSNESDRI